MNTGYNKAFTEVLYLINNMGEVDRNKISNNFIDFMEKNCDPNYEVKDIYLNKPDTLLTETKIILSLIYRSYFCDEETRRQKEKEDIEYLNKKYDVNKIFESNIPTKIQIIENIKVKNSDELAMIKVSKLQKLINKIKNIFKKGK